MEAIDLGRESVLSYLVEGVVIACENSPQNTTISDDEESLDKVLQTIKKAHPGVLVQRLKVGTAYHSHE